MPRIFIPDIPAGEDRFSITGEKAKYLDSVLRCRKGDELIIFDGKGNCLRTNILKVDRRQVIADILEKFTCYTESPVNLILVQSILKGEKMDIVIQKATELGIKEIIPVITERSQLRETRKATRWKKIAEEASRQSGRSIIPSIHEPAEFKKILNTYFPQNKSCGFIFYEEEGVKLSEAVSSLVPRSSTLFIFVGPEGGFTKQEVSLAKEKGLFVISLGNRILRAETAAITAVSIIQYEFGDIG
jgi:16S rRNA (uracil1498-N3)-methyltransferase